ncbi:MAG: hypothetical protein ACLSIL_16070 [Enterococcus casseliflavus]
MARRSEGALNGIAGVIPPVVSAVDTMAGGVIAVKDASADAAPYIIGFRKRHLAVC